VNPILDPRAYSASDFDGPDGSAKINAALLAAASSTKPRARVVVPSIGPDEDGTWSISESVRIPSGTTLILDDCLLRLADGANCPLIVNAGRDQGGDRDISIIGRGVARLDGNPGNQSRARRGRDVEIWMEAAGLPLSRATRATIGELSVAEYEQQRSLPGESLEAMMSGPSGLDFAGVDHLRIESIEVGPTNLFGIHASACNDVVIKRIHFCQDGSEPNQDGIGIFGPAERIVISGITGTCGDDAVGLHAIHPVHGGGAICGVVISDVIVRNRWNSGILRTEGPALISSVVASNLVMLDGEGYSEGHSVVKIGTTRGSLVLEMAADDIDPLTEVFQEGIQIHGLAVEGWVGPVIAIYQPIANLVMSGVTGTHTGPLFVNFESKIDGLLLANVATRMIPTPADEPFVGGMLQYSMMANALPRSIREDERAAIILDGGDVRGVAFMNVRVALDRETQEQAKNLNARTVGLLDRTDNADRSITARWGLTFPGFEHDEATDSDATGRLSP
jgi:hypothetical protein